MARPSLPDATWEECRLRYEAGETIMSLAKAYGVTRSAIHNRIARYGWVKPGEAKRATLEEAKREATRRFNITFATEFLEINEYHFALMQMGLNVCLDMLKTIKAGGDIRNKVYSLQALQTTLTGFIDSQRRIRGLDKMQAVPAEKELDALLESFSTMRKDMGIDETPVGGKSGETVAEAVAAELGD